MATKGAAWCQEPASYLLGEDQFKGVKIYDLIQDNDQHYWISTDEGLYEYDYQKYKRVDAKNARTNALFQFVKNNSGTIYCVNLSNQIFEIKNGECRLFYEVSKLVSGSSIKIAISPNNNLIVSADFITIISPKAKPIVRKHLKGIVTSVACFRDKSIHFTLDDGKLLQFNGKRWTTENNESEYKTALFVELGKHHYLYNSQSRKLFRYSPQKRAATGILLNVLNAEKYRYYSAANHLWFSGVSQGVYCYSEKSGKLTHYFKDYFISDVFEDEEGNVLLSTFDHGIIVVPDLAVPGVLPSFENGEVVALYNDPELGFVCGTDQGAIYAFKNKRFRSIIPAPETKISVEGIYGNGKLPFLLTGNGAVVALDKYSGKLTNILLGSLKDIVFTGDNTFYVATNKGLYFVEWKGGQRFETKQIYKLNFRIYALAYDAQNDGIYASTAKGLMYLQGGKVRPITYQNKELYVSDFYQRDGIVWAATQNFGILKFSNTQIVGVIQPKVDGSIESINQFVVAENHILASTSSGFYKFTTSGSVIDALHISNSFGSRRVYDFIVDDSKVLVSHFGGVQELNLKYRLRIPGSSHLQISAVLTNNKPLGNNRELTAKNNNISFVLTAPSLRNRHIEFAYKLSGYNDSWIQTDNQTNVIAYNALPPGNYVFMVKQEDNRGSTRLLHYAFTVQSPFYFSWWFIALLLITVILLLYLLVKKIRANASGNTTSEEHLHAVQLRLLTALQELNARVELPLNALHEKWLSKESIRSVLESNFPLQLNEETTLEIDWKLQDDGKIPVWCLIPFVYQAFSFGFNGKVGQKLLRITLTENQEMVLCTIEDNIPRFTTNRSDRLEKDKQLGNNTAMHDLLHQLYGTSLHLKISHNEKISGEQMLGTTLAITIPKQSE